METQIFLGKIFFEVTLHTINYLIKEQTFYPKEITHYTIWNISLIDAPLFRLHYQGLQLFLAFLECDVEWFVFAQGWQVHMGDSISSERAEQMVQPQL